VRRLNWLILVSALALIPSGSGTVLAQREEPSALIDELLEDYQLAFATGNPFLLQQHDPSLKVFGPLLLSTWYDHVARSAVNLADRSVTTLSPEDWTYSVSFLKTQEDILRNGLFTRGLAQVTMDVRILEGKVFVLSHRVTSPKGASSDYRSNEPRSWGAEHAAAERSLFSGLDFLREGDLKSAEAAIESSVAQVEAGDLPEFVLGPNYFSAMAYYYLAMLKAKRGDYANASRELDLSLSLHPDFPAALNLRAEVHYNEGDFDKASRLWRKSLSLAAMQSDVYEVATLMDAVIETRDEKLKNLLLSLVELPPARAVELLAPAVKNRPRHQVLVPLMVKAHLGAGDAEKAVEVLDASRLVGREVEPTYLAARARLKLGQVDSAVALFEGVWKEEPGYRDSEVFLVYLYAAMGRFQEAIEILGSPGVDPGNGITHALKSKFNLMAGRHLDAFAELDLATQARLPARLRSEVAYLVERISRPTEVEH